MESCSLDCHKTAAAVVDQQISGAAERLACILIENPVFQEFVRMSHSVRQDAQVNAILNEMNARAYASDPTATHAAAASGSLEAQLEALPAVVAFRKAEAAAQELFRAVDDVISEAAGGIAFAENAKPAACG